MNEARPDTLLKSALEKIVYFEARSEQIQNDLAGVRAEAQRLKQELAEAAQREIALRRQVAEMEVTVARAHRDKHELGGRVDALLQERTAVLAKLIDGARIREAGQAGIEEAGLDLASFISELRGEVLAARAQAKGGRTVQPAQVVQPHAVVATVEVSATTSQGERLQSEGRLGVSEEQVLALSSRGRVGRSEQTLFGFSVRELAAPDGKARARAAERLRALGDTAAAPALAAALHSEDEPAVQVTLLTAFSALAQAEGAAVAAALLTSSSPDVRIAALKAVLHLDPASAVPHLAAAAKDPDPAVRRRASLLALTLRGEEAAKLSEETTHDRDPEVRRLTALALGASGRAQARSQLMGFLEDGDVRVRRAAAQSLGRMLGRDITPLVELDEPQRRREVRRLAQLPLPPLRPVPSTRAILPVAPPPSGPSLEEVCGNVMSEIRSAIRGRALPDLAQTSGVAESQIEQACELLVARGQVVRRGLKYFTA